MRRRLLHADSCGLAHAPQNRDGRPKPRIAIITIRPSRRGGEVECLPFGGGAFKIRKLRGSLTSDLRSGLLGAREPD